jgi:hypothetical protein
VVTRDWGGGKVLTHAGSNTMFYSVMWLAPLKDFAVVVSTNLGGNDAAQGCDRVAALMIRVFLVDRRQ